MRKQLLFAAAAVAIVACGDNQISSPSKAPVSEARSGTKVIGGGFENPTGEF